jgi:ribosomally synthesized peptide (two-chain TOMM family)
MAAGAASGEVSKWQSTLPKVIGRAWSDPSFEDKLVSDPKAALAEFDLDPPDDMDIHVERGQAGSDQPVWRVDNQDNVPVYTLTLPPKPAGVGDEALAAGATDGVTVCCSICCCC